MRIRCSRVARSRSWRARPLRFAPAPAARRPARAKRKSLPPCWRGIPRSSPSHPARRGSICCVKTFGNAVRLRDLIEKFDATNGPSRREFLDEGTQLVAGGHIRNGRRLRVARCLRLRRAPRCTAEDAERVLGRTGLAVLAVVIVVSIALMISITRPYSAGSPPPPRQLAAGNRTARAPRGGAAEIDALAESINADGRSGGRRGNGTSRASRGAGEARRGAHASASSPAHHDPLTQFPNRRQLSARLGGALSRASNTGQQLALLFVDLDNFKSINDTLGHNFGDRVLQLVAERLRSAAGPAQCSRAWVAMSSRC